MPATRNTLRVLQKPGVDRDLEAFLVDRRARGLSPQSVRYYTHAISGGKEGPRQTEYQDDSLARD